METRLPAAPRRERSLEQLVRELAEGDLAQRRLACQRLAELGEEARPAAVALAAATAEPELVEWAAEALENLGPPPVDAIAPLRQQLTHASADVGYWAATLLGRLRADAAAASGALAQALQASPHASVRQRAAWALGELGPAAAAAAPALEQAAQSDDPRLARLAQGALARVRE